MISIIRIALITSSFALGAASTPAALTGRVTLNDTGMAQCISRYGDWTLDCSKSWQDAAYGRDVKDANPNDGGAGFSFQKVCRSGQLAGEGSCPIDPVLGNEPDNWGCVLDNVTQLIWEAKTDDGGPHDGNHTFTNKGRKARDDPTDVAWLIDSTNAESLCGATNWRLPDPLELQSLVYYGMGTPNPPSATFIDPTFFPFSWNWITWTEAESIDDPKWAWYVNFDDGRVSVRQRFYSNASARLVHDLGRAIIGSRNASGKERFVPSDDGSEVTDTMTGLVWRRCVEGMNWNADVQTCTGSVARFHWLDALEYVKANHTGGWRIPNAKELFSIVDVEKQSPALDGFAFPNAPTTGVFSSTPVDIGGEVFVKYVSFSLGVLEQQTLKRDRFALRFVRRGRE